MAAALSSFYVPWKVRLRCSYSCLLPACPDGNRRRGSPRVSFTSPGAATEGGYDAAEQDDRCQRRGLGDWRQQKSAPVADVNSGRIIIFRSDNLPGVVDALCSR